MSEQQTQTENPVWRQAKRDAYQAMCDRVERQCGEREPTYNPWPHLPFYQLMGLMAGAVGRTMQDELDRAHDARIEAQNPGIDMEQVRAERAERRKR